MTDQSRLQFTDAHIERMLVERAGPGAPADLVTSIAAAIESTGQRAPGLLGAVWGPAASPTRRGPLPVTQGRILQAAALGIAVVVVAAGASLFLRLPPALIGGPSSPPSIAPVPSSSVAPSPSPSSSAIATHRPAAVIAFIWRVDRGNTLAGTNRIWLAAADGGGPHELLPGGTGNESSVAWSPDGLHLVYAEDGSLYITDLAAAAPQRVDTGCGPEFFDADPAFSADGREIVFRHGCTGRIATMDLASGRVVDLESTAAVRGDRPRWSPDGRQIVFSTSYKAPGGTDVYMVDADGQNLHKLTTKALPGRYPEWSRDGTRIVYTSFVSKILGSGANAYDQVRQNVYTVRPDGTDLRRLTTDGISVGGSWTSDERILFGRLTQDGAQGEGGLWTMDADGSGVERVYSGPTELTSEMYVGYPAAWQPTP